MGVGHENYGPFQKGYPAALSYGIQKVTCSLSTSLGYVNGSNFAHVDDFDFGLSSGLETRLFQWRFGGYEC